ncbi:putative helix-turn-helix domain protein [uncultured Caudovirales phage]|uniref:Putative helix-turn-helix domain protein n=1 Tax=uncultured Caudovirales phage TaxID=2100421 RepID=A0A2H4J076_9CAUD|nr:putative helix-turn-helix domain protein [uncultured Caudovirales phage]
MGVIMDTISTLGLNIKRIREKKGISAYRLAKDACVGSATLSQIETGKRQSLNTNTIEKIATVLSVTTDELLSMENTNKCITTDIHKIINQLNISDITLDNATLSNLEKKQITMTLKNCIEIIRLQRKEPRD